MRHKRHFIFLLIFFMLILGFFPLNKMVELIFREDGKAVEPVKPALTVSRPKTQNTPPKEAKKIKPAKQYLPQTPADSKKITAPPVIIPEIASIPKEVVREKLEVKLFDAMEDKSVWENKKDDGTNSDIGIHRGIDGKALAFYYNLGKNGWAVIQKTGDWDMSGYKGLRFSCKVDGSLGKLLLAIGDKNDFFIEKSWDKDKLLGSAWKMYSVFFESGTDYQVRPIGGKVNKIRFKVVSDVDDAELKGRVIIDNLELIK